MAVTGSTRDSSQKAPQSHNALRGFAFGAAEKHQPVRMLDSWAEELAQRFRFSKNNGIPEGFHRNMTPSSDERPASGMLKTTACVSASSADRLVKTPPEWRPHNSFARF